MELSEFIHKSIVDICNGIRDARDEVAAATDGYPIAPASINGKPHFDKLMEKIEFDICVTTTQASQKSGKGGLSINVVSLSGKLENSNQREDSNRIKFAIPFYPAALRVSKDKS